MFPNLFLCVYNIRSSYQTVCIRFQHVKDVDILLFSDQMMNQRLRKELQAVDR